MQVLRSKSIGQLRSMEFSLNDEALRIREKDLRGAREHLIDYDRIGREPCYFHHRSLVALGFALFFTILAIATGLSYLRGGDAEAGAWIIWLCVASIFYLWYFATSRKGWAVTSSFGSVVLPGRPATFDHFFHELSKKKLQSIEGRARHRLEILDASEVEAYLLSIQEAGVISLEEYQQLRFSLGFKRRQSESIGFGN